MPPNAMLAKLTAKNQLTLPKAATAAVGVAEYFDVQAGDGVIILRPVRIQRADAVRAKLAELNLGEGDIEDAIAWARRPTRRVAEPQERYPAKPAAKSRKPAKRKP